MEKFEHEGKEYWEKFGKISELLPRHYFDFIDKEKYEKLFEGRDLKNKKVIDLGAGYPPPPKESPEKRFSPLASELQEVLKNKGAEIIALDAALDPLRRQKESGKEAIAGNVFELPLKNESIDGGAIILNLFNSSFKSESGKEVFITLEECKKILQEVNRILQKDAFVMINNYGYIIAKMDNIMQFIGPDENEIITMDSLRDIAKEAGLSKINEIPVDEKRLELSKKIIIESFSEILRGRINIDFSGSGALMIEK